VAGVLFYTDVVEVAIDYVAIKAISGLWNLVNSGALAETVEVAFGRIAGLVTQETAIEGARMENGIGSMLLMGLI
jgi:hypothetical protein